MSNETQIKAIASLIENICSQTTEYRAGQTKEQRKVKGQFFTPLSSARFMASLIDVSEKHRVSLIEPGAGNGLLSLVAIERLLASPNISTIELTLVENDPDVLPMLYCVSSDLKAISNEGRVKIDVEIIEDNFILHEFSAAYDVAICNPPYFKIGKGEKEAEAMKDFIYGQPNIYALFVVRIAQILNHGGVYSLITPRSWASGSYFMKMRSYILQETSINRIHLFDERGSAFASEDVLQETMIWSGVKGIAQGEVRLSSSRDSSFNDVSSFKASPDELVVLRGTENAMLLPASAEDCTLLKSIQEEANTFDTLGYVFKTGPVVEFRNKDIITTRKNKHSIPMIRSSNIGNDGFIFPINSGKAQYISPDAKPSLRIINAPTLIVRRLTAKEEPRRLQCCKYTPIEGADYISIENHVNYLARKDGKALTEAEIKWAYDIISSPKYDRYYRMLGGSTQVNAKDLNALPVARRKA